MYMTTHLARLVYERQSNKNIDIKFSVHDAFLEFLYQVRSKSKD